MTAAQKMMMAAPAAGGGAFNPETDIAWHSLFWAEGTDFAAEGYADGDSVTTWPNETGEQDASTVAGTVSYDAAHASFNNQPVVHSSSGTAATGTFDVAPDYTSGVTIVAVGKFGVRTGYGVLADGVGQRNAVMLSSGATQWLNYAGGSLTGAGTTDTDPHLFAFHFTGDTGNEVMDIDGVTIRDNVDMGSNQITNYKLGGTAAPDIAFLGIFEGDITQDASYGDFKTWVGSHYGITIA